MLPLQIGEARRPRRFSSRAKLFCRPAVLRGRISSAESLKVESAGKFSLRAPTRPQSPRFGQALRSKSRPARADLRENVPQTSDRLLKIRFRILPTCPAHKKLASARKQTAAGAADPESDG